MLVGETLMRAPDPGRGARGAAGLPWLTRAPFLIKICGVTSAEDAAMAASAGAGAIGVNFWPGSKRFVGGEAAARRVLAAIPPGVLRVGVFVNAAPAEVERARSGARAWIACSCTATRRRRHSARSRARR